MSPKKKRDSDAERVVKYALLHPLGRYLADRASQLSGVPRSTLYDWRRNGVYAPDFDGAQPAAWSYRDLVFLRLTAWLRQLGMMREEVADRVQTIKAAVGTGEEIRRVRTNVRTMLVDAELMSRFGDPSLLPFKHLNDLLSTFDLHEPIEELRPRGRRSAWAPDLITPSLHTFISPLVLAGDPCIERTRIPSSTVHALREERGLDSAGIVELYPELTIDAIDDAYTLERRLRGLELPQPTAA